jgi:hypothetical protein
VNPRQKHDDSGQPLGPVGTEVQRILFAVDADLKGAITALTNGLKKHPELEDRQGFVGLVAALKETAKGFRAHHPAGPCVFCLALVKKDPKVRCQACQGTRWLSKAELEAAPAELRKAAGL